MLDNFFAPKSVAVVGASENSRKLGHVVLKSVIDGGFSGRIYPINPHSTHILGYKAYRSVIDTPGTIDLAVVVVPKEVVPAVIDDCGKKRIRCIVVISSGFSEVGDHKSEESLKAQIKKYNMRLVGPNCLGILVPSKKLDMIFLPRSRFKRPQSGGISFISQSGAIGSCVLDLMAKEGTGIAKFVSYGNAADVSEIKLLQALVEDKETKVICMYVEGLKDGQKFLEAARYIAKKKPLILLKGGVSEFGARAVASHTASLAGSGEVFRGACKQAHIVYAESLEEMYDFARLFDKAVPPKGFRVQIITNGGGYGIMCADALHKYNLQLASPSRSTEKALQKALPKIAIISNPIDLTGGATTEDYIHTIDACLRDSNSDILAIITLLQTPLVTPDIVDALVRFHRMKKKPLVVIAAGGNFTEIHKTALESAGVPTFTFAENAVKAIRALCSYYLGKW